MKINIIILNWNGMSDTITCIDSLKKNNLRNAEIIVVDNGSKNNEGQKLKEKYGSLITLIPLKNNTGFTGGVNAGIAYGTANNADCYILLNNDTQVNKDFIERLVEEAYRNKKIGLVSPVIYNMNKKDEILYSGGNINWLLARPYPLTEPISSNRNAQFITGCAVLIKGEVIRKIGPLDERYFAYFEDVAFCIKAIHSGFECIYTPSTYVFHKESASSGKSSAMYTYLFARNRTLFVNHNTPLLYRLYYIVFNFVKMVIALTIFQIKEPHRVKPYFKGYIDGHLDRGGYPNI